MSGLHEAFDEIVADVPVYGDLDRAIAQAEQERRRRPGLVAGLSAAAAVLVLIVGALAITGDDNAGSPPPIGPLKPTETTTDAAEWYGPIRPGNWPVLSLKKAKGWADPRDAAVPGIDIRSVNDERRGSIMISVVNGRDVRRMGVGRWEFTLAALPPRTESLDPARGVFEYGVVIDADGDRDADCQAGMNNDAARQGEYRVWVENLRTGVIDERVGGPYGYPIEFVHAGDDGYRDGPNMVLTFLQNPPTPCDRFGTSAAYYVWASLTETGRVTAWDYAPDAAWLPLPCNASCRELQGW